MFYSKLLLLKSHFLPFFIFSFLSFQNLSSQNIEWINYTYNDDIRSIVGKGNTLWIATSGGLVKYNIQTEVKEFFNVSNSDLISNSVSPLALDSLGNVWMWISFGRAFCWHKNSTDYLVKFDGSEWTYFSPGINICETWSLFPRTMEIDKSNNIWLGTYDNGLINFNGDTWSFFDTTNSNIPTNNIVSLAIDDENNKWMGSYEVNGLIKFNDTNWTVFDSTNSGCPNERIVNIKIDPLGNKWLTTFDKIIKFDDNSWSIYATEIPKPSYIQPGAIAIDSNNELWLFYSDLYHLNSEGWKVYYQKPQDNFRSCNSFFIDKYNNKWLNSDEITLERHTDYFNNGLLKFKDNNWQLISLSNSKFKGKYVDELFKDSKNNMWVYSGILTKIKGDTWTYFTPEKTLLPERAVTSINEDVYGNLWFGTYSDGLIKFNGTSWEKFDTTNSDIPDNEVGDIDFDKNGNLWFITKWDIGVVKFDGNNWTVYDTTNSGLPTNHIINIESDSKGNLWFGTAHEGLVKYENTTWTVYNTQIKWNEINSLHIDDEDAVWIGGFGLTKFKNGIWSYYEHSDSIDYYYNIITQLSQDRNNNIWAVARYGLYKFDGTNWQTFNHTNAGLPDEFLNDIEFDEYGNLWIGTSSGVILYNNGGVVPVNSKYLLVQNQHTILLQNYPNPFNPTTIIKYSIPSSSVMLSGQSRDQHKNNEIPDQVRNDNVSVSLKVYDILGREVAALVNEKQKPGSYEITWDASNQPSGVYFYQLSSGDFVEVKKMILLK